jgi:hypothetical protein
VKVGFRESFLKDVARVKDKRLLQRVRATIESVESDSIFRYNQNNQDLTLIFPLQQASGNLRPYGYIIAHFGIRTMER